MSHAQLVERAKELIDALAQEPRFAGSAAESRARELCRVELERAGFQCREVPFEYSQWLGKWGPAFVAVVVAGLLIVLAELARRQSEFVGLGAVVVLLVAGRLNVAAVRHGWILNFPWSRAKSTNLEARRGEPRVWLMAHLDTKSQTLSMLLRISGTIALQLGGLLIVVGSLASLASERVGSGLLVAGELLAILGAVGVGLCFVGDRSPGAVDNATGVAAAILAAQSRNAPPSLGVLITSGEELGLAGAFAWARTAPERIVILNCDTIDEAGTFRCMNGGSPALEVVRAAGVAAKRLGVDLRVGRVIPGIMADSMAFAGSTHCSAITLSRGTLSTLARIHTPRDTSTRLTGEGTANASVLLAAMAGELS